MKKFYLRDINHNTFKLIDFLLIFLFAIVPLFASFNYRINIYLAWEGAYRMSQGQFPYRDFGLPLGFGFWLLPSLFFKLLGPQMITLVKTQVFINIISGLAFRQILKNFGIQQAVITLSLLTFCISYTFINAWPWYNHTVIVFQLIGFAFITWSYKSYNLKKVWWQISLGSIFIILSFFTKQDAGFLGFLIVMILTITFSILNKKWLHTIILLSSTVAISTILIASLNSSFFYWFNYGQSPHNSRLSVLDIINEFFLKSQWIRFYLFGVVIVVVHAISRKIKFTTLEVLFILFFVGILAEASIFQVTSYVPEDNNIFFHSFATAFVLWYLTKTQSFKTNQSLIFISFASGILLIWSSNYWKYADRFLQKFQHKTVIASNGENLVDKTNYIKDTFRKGSIPTSEWIEGPGYAFEKIKMPRSTVEGISRLKNMPEMQSQENKKILNMSELTPLAYELNFNLETGPNYPLWYHLGVGMFNKQLNMFQERIRNNYYDVVIYEYIPFLNNYYPLTLHEQLKKEYTLKDTFLAPRDPTNANIEVYVKKQSNN